MLNFPNISDVDNLQHHIPYKELVYFKTNEITGINNTIFEIERHTIQLQPTPIKPSPTLFKKEL